MKRVLLIDDDEAVAAALSLVLRGAGYDVVTAPGGREGVRLFRRRAFDLVVTDMIMPEQDGVETIVALRRLRADVQIVAISSGGEMLGTEYLGNLVRKLGVTRLLAKPCTPAAFLEAVAGAVNQVDSAA